MCGINCIFSYGDAAAPISHGELISVRDAMVSRGPDGAGVWTSPDGLVGLGHRRLAIIDVQGGAQPMTLSLKDSGAVITYNGELYNYRELRKELIAAGCVFESESDTEVLLHLYHRYGQEMLSRLRGMFAFAIWDLRTRSLFLARDQFGIKPLYYADNGQTFRAASQVKALLAGQGCDTSVDAAGHVGFFLFGYVPEPFTFYTGIRSLPAGSSLLIDADGNRTHTSYFDITAELKPSSVEPFNNGELHRYLKKVLTDSVQGHMISDVPVGVFLSSGIDSTTIAALANQRTETRLNTITLGFDKFRGSRADETAIAEQVAARLDTEHKTRWIQQREFEDEYENILAVMDQPSVDGINTYFVAKAAAETGLKVALSGLGGDELFGGYPSFTQVPKLVGVLSPFRFLPALGKTCRMISSQLISKIASPKFASLLEYGTSFHDAYFLRRALFMPWELSSILDPDLVRDGLTQLAPLVQLENSISGLDGARTQITKLELSWYLKNQLLRTADWAGMAHSVEIRTPLVDIEVFKAIAPLLHRRDPPSKRDLGHVGRNHLPDSVFRRPKATFSVPLAHWLSTSGHGGGSGLRDLASAIYCDYAKP